MRPLERRDDGRVLNTSRIRGSLGEAVVTAYRRHLSDCPQRPKGRRWNRCACPIWVQGTLGGEVIRRSLDLTSWEAAADRVRGWEASGTIGIVKTESRPFGKR